MSPCPYPIFRNRKTGVLVKKAFDQEEGIIFAGWCYWQIESIDKWHRYIGNLPYACIEEVEGSEKWECINLTEPEYMI